MEAMLRHRWVISLVAAFIVSASGIAVASHQSWRVDDGCSYSNTTYFYRDGPAQNWNIHSGALKAYQDCHVWTKTVTTSLVNSAYWYKPVSVNYAGYYYVWLFIACEDVSGHFGARDARYRRYGYGTQSGVTELYHFNQKQASNCSTTSVSKNLTAQGDGSGYDHFAAEGYIRMIDRSDYGGENLSADMLEYTPRQH
jgi:hypothetical protein